MNIFSLDFEDGGAIPRRFTCDDKDISPNLIIENVPKGAESLALVIDDPDAPSGTWTHWLVWNIPPQTNEIGQATVPEGAIEGVNSSGGQNYSGPCPPNGTHRYFFRLFALDTKLDADGSADRAEVEEEMLGHVIETAEVMGTYARQ